MARLESVAIGGYYATPPHLINRIASLVARPEGRPKFAFMDPCAADGEAILSLGEAILGEKGNVTYYTCELEGTRFAKLSTRIRETHWGSSSSTLSGDAFRIQFDRGSKTGAHVLYLNPPYDTDRVHGRLEQKFLARFTPALAMNGLLIFVVPYYALSASAHLLAQEYAELRCYRFPGDDFNGYKQVVLYARRTTPSLEPDAALLAQVESWATNADGIPELPLSADPLYSVDGSSEWESGLYQWQMREFDVAGLLSKIRPWMHSTRSGDLVPVPGILPDLPVNELLTRRYPVATPPRPAHIAAGIASGLFNGSRIEPTSQDAGLPALLVKGVFDKEYKTVEQKKGKDGEVRGVVQVQQPKLITTVLDLSTHQYHVLGVGGETQGAPSVDRLTVADLLKHYGDSLMSVMEAQCPITYDPRKDAASIPLPSSPRRLFAAQAHAVRAIVRLLGGPVAGKAARRHTSAILLGEIGSGKSTVALMSARTIGARRMLVMCPPHLLKGWTNEVASVLPDAEVRVLSTVTDVDALKDVPEDRTVIAILSREAAKLSHGWRGADGLCPRCGAQTPTDVDLAKKRQRCPAKVLTPKSKIGEAALRLAYKLVPYAGSPEANLGSVLRSRFDRKRLALAAARNTAGKGPAFVVPQEALRECLAELLSSWTSNGGGEALEAAIGHVLVALGDDSSIVEAARYIKANKREYDYQAEGLLRGLCLLLPPGSEIQATLLAEVRDGERQSFNYNPWDLSGSIKSLTEGAAHGPTLGRMPIKWVDDKIELHGARAGTKSATFTALRHVGNLGQFTFGEECGEALFQADRDTPRRVALARYISQRHPALFDFLVLDEGHEYATDGTAQERSAHRLTSLGIPTVLMTGTIMNGYAESLFTNMWALSAAFREEFSRDERQRFVDRYGYRKRLVEDKDQDSGKVIEFGSMSDRVTRSERVIGNAPGVLPLFLLRHLLPIAVTLHKTDLAIDLPPCTQHRHLIDPGHELLGRFIRLQEQLVAQIKEDQWEPDLAGRLWGQLAELPSYLDRATADTGNCESGAYEIRYPESLNSGLVASQEPFSKDTLLPKEEWMLDVIERELSEDRNVMVFSWHVTLLPRLARLIEARTGGKVPVLYADKVSTGKRQDWIDREVVKKGRRVLVTNPVAIQTGLNNLVHFASEIWMENPACNPVIYRQAIGRVDRIGQKIATRIHVPVYADTLQVQMYDLLMKKVAVSISTDGLDPESALQAAGVGEDEYMTGLSIGKQLWAMLNEGVSRDDSGPIFHARGTVPTSTEPPPKSSNIADMLSMLDDMAQAG